MVDVLRPGAADGAIEGPIIIEREEIDQPTRLGTPLGFTAADALTGVFNHLPAHGNKLGCVHAPAMDFRGGKSHAEARVSRIDAGRAFSHRLIL